MRPHASRLPGRVAWWHRVVHPMQEEGFPAQATPTNFAVSLLLRVSLLFSYYHVAQPAWLLALSKPRYPRMASERNRCSICGWREGWGAHAPVRIHPYLSSCCLAFPPSDPGSLDPCLAPEWLASARAAPITDLAVVPPSKSSFWPSSVRQTDRLLDPTRPVRLSAPQRVGWQCGVCATVAGRQTTMRPGTTDWTTSASFDSHSYRRTSLMSVSPWRPVFGPSLGTVGSRR